jgi:hypothetical protein
MIAGSAAETVVPLHNLPMSVDRNKASEQTTQ